MLRKQSIVKEFKVFTNVLLETKTQENTYVADNQHFSLSGKKYVNLYIIIKKKIII